MDGCQVGKKLEKDLESIKIPVNQVKCGGCCKSLEMQLSEVDGIADVDCDLDSKQLFVDFYPGKITPAQIEAKVKEILDDL